MILIHEHPNPIANYHSERFMQTAVVPRQLTDEVRTIERTAEVGLDDLGLPAAIGNERTRLSTALRRRRMINSRLKVFAIAEERGEVFLLLSPVSFLSQGTTK